MPISLDRFSPVARILLIETGLPGPQRAQTTCFSPVARILLIETIHRIASASLVKIGFSPVARILLIETFSIAQTPS